MSAATIAAMMAVIADHEARRRREEEEDDYDFDPSDFGPQGFDWFWVLGLGMSPLWVILLLWYFS